VTNDNQLLVNAQRLIAGIGDSTYGGHAAHSGEHLLLPREALSAPGGSDHDYRQFRLTHLALSYPMLAQPRFCGRVHDRSWPA
jgi:hypothetical protein